MNLDLRQLEEYYLSEHSKKIFCTKLCVEGRCFNILYDYDKSDEINKFVSNFTEYLPYYVFNADTLECIEYDNSLSESLLDISKKCWNGPTVPSRDKNVNGIFGELFLDFYERIIKKSKLACTYASRRDFRNNGENKGFDNVLFSLNNGEIAITFAEAKFVSDKSSATTALIKDIRGDSNDKGTTPGHLTKEFLNEYIEFIVTKNSYFSDSDKVILKSFFTKLNKVLVNGESDFVSFLLENDIRINCVFFALFQNMHFNPEYYISAYDNIYNEAKNHLEAMGFVKYSIEIVFIPTNSKSVEIKGAIDGYYK